MIWTQIDNTNKKPLEVDCDYIGQGVAHEYKIVHLQADRKICVAWIDGVPDKEFWEKGTLEECKYSCEMYDIHTFFKLKLMEINNRYPMIAG
jgi:hypothetical protein